MKKAQMGGAYAQRRAYKSAGAPKKTQESKAPGFGKDIPGKEGGKSRVNMAEREKRIKANELEGYRKAFKDNYNKNTSTISAPSNTAGSRASDSSNPSRSNSPTPPVKAETKAETKSAPKPGIRMSASKLPTSTKQLEKSKPIDVSYKRTYSDIEKKMQEVMAKGKQADGTMSESAQAKLKALQAKRRMASQKSEKDKSKEAKKATGRSEDYIKNTMKGIRKEAKVSKRAAVKTAKANLKATRKS